MRDPDTYQSIWQAREEYGGDDGGAHESILLGSGQTLKEVKEDAISLRALYSETGIKLPANSDLLSIIEQAIHITDEWEAGVEKTEAQAEDIFYRAYHLDRIFKSALPLINVAEETRSHYLRKLSHNNGLLPYSRGLSEAINFLWELELWSALQSAGVDSSLLEPDVVAHLPTGDVGLACKKVYSSKGIAKTTSDGMKQVAKHNGGIGLLAFNLDYLFPSNWINAASMSDYSIQLSNFNSEFMNEQRSTLLRYLPNNRAISILASTAVMGRIGSRIVRLRQFTFWTPPSAGFVAQHHALAFQRALFAKHEVV